MSLLKNLKQRATIDFSTPSPSIETTKKTVASADAEADSTTVLKSLSPASLARNAAIQRNEIFKENEVLKEKMKDWDGAKKAILIDPALIKQSKWANRHQESFKTEEYRELVAEIAHAHGNIQPIKVRPLQTSPSEYEIIFGHRRHQACLELGIPVLAMVQEIDDAALFIEMDRENRQRVDLRPFEQGMMYKQALDAGLYPTLSALCAATGASQGKSSIALRLARCNLEVLKAFSSPLDVQFRWVTELLDLLDKSPDVLLKRAHDLASRRAQGELLTPKQVFSELTVPTLQKSKSEAKPIKRSVQVNGKTIASITFAKDQCSIQFKKGGISQEQITMLEQAIQSLLK